MFFSALVRKRIPKYRRVTYPILFLLFLLYFVSFAFIIQFSYPYHPPCLFCNKSSASIVSSASAFPSFNSSNLYSFSSISSLHPSYDLPHSAFPISLLNNTFDSTVFTTNTEHFSSLLPPKDPPYAIYSDLLFTSHHSSELSAEHFSSLVLPFVSRSASVISSALIKQQKLTAVDPTLNESRYNPNIVYRPIAQYWFHALFHLILADFFVVSLIPIFSIRKWEGILGVFIPSVFILIFAMVTSFLIVSGYDVLKLPGGTYSYRRKYTANSTNKSPFLLVPPVARPEASDSIETTHEFNTIFSTIVNFIFMFLFIAPQLIVSTMGYLAMDKQINLLALIFFNSALNMLSLQDFFLAQKLRSFHLFSFL